MLSLNNNLFVMKMFGEKSLSFYLFYITRIFSIVIGVLLLFIIFSFVTGNYNLNEGRFAINISFLEVAIKGFYKFNIIATISTTLLLYTVFFYLLSLIFKTFKAKILFTEIAIKRLNIFALFNLVGTPFFFVIIHFVIMKHKTFRDLPTYILHLLLGIFILFIVAIFKRGYKVQSENDLTI